MSETEVTTDTQVDNTDDLDAFTLDLFGQRKTESTEAKVEVEQEDDPTDEEEVTEAQNTTDELTDEDVKEEDEAPPPKPKSKVQERIDELVRQREETKREAEALRKEFEEFKKAQTTEKPAVKTNEPTPEDILESGEAKYPLGEFDPAYIRDLTRFTLAQERAQAKIRDEVERSERIQQEAQTALLGSWNEKVTAAKAQYPDLQEKAETLLRSFDGLETGYAGYLSTVLMSMDHGPDVLYYLSNNPEEATQIVNSGAQKATLALGRIEAKFYEVDAQKQLAKPKVSKAPPPPTATARGTGGGAKTVEPDTDDLDAFTQEFFRKRK